MHATQFGLERHILRLETYRVTTYVLYTFLPVDMPLAYKKKIYLN